MAPPERFVVPVSHLTMILAEEGPPKKKLRKKKFVLKLFIGNFKCLKFMFKEKLVQYSNRSCGAGVRGCSC